MNYLFFDIECSDGTHIMSFGYVLTDSNFNILKKEDILMNPEAIFHTGAWGKKNRELEPGVKIGYPKEEFLKRPNFSHYYKKIKEIITKDDQIVLGFSHKNDTGFLDTACKRYGLDSIDYDFFDVQTIHKELNGLKNPESTDTIVDELGLDKERYVTHRSDDDSEVSMILTKMMCQKENVPLKKLLERFPNSWGKHFNFRAVYLYKTRAESLIMSINGNTTTGNNTMNHSNIKKFYTFIDDIIVDNSVSKIFCDKVFSFSTFYFDNHFREMLLLVQNIMDRGGVFTRYPTDSNVYVYDKTIPEDEKKHIDNLLKRGKDIVLVNLTDLLKTLKIDKSYFKKYQVVNKKI